jgi:hypothetical protein
MFANFLQLALPGLAFFGTVSSFLIPDGQPDGVYMYSVDEFGIGTHTRLNATEHTTPRSPVQIAGRAVEKRVSWPGGTTIECQSAYLWSDNLYNGAYDDFFNQCWTTHHILNFQKSLYSSIGQAKAYICNYDYEFGSVCQTDEWVEFVNWASGQCSGGTDGWKQAGMSLSQGDLCQGYRD